MDFLLLLVLGIPVVWLFAKERKRSEDREQSRQLLEAVQSLERRLWLLEDAARRSATLTSARQDPRTARNDHPEAKPAHVAPQPQLFVSSTPDTLDSEHVQTAAIDTLPAPVVAESALSIEADLAAAQPPLADQSIDASPVYTASDGARNQGATETKATAEPQLTRSPSLEERFGANWLNKLGIVILVIGLSLFLAYQLRALGALGKTVIGYVLSAVLLVGGLFLERRTTYRVFARAALGGGWALTFFVVYAMYHVAATHVISSQALDLILMMLTAVGMVWHSLRYKSQVVTGLAFLLAFATVAISHVTLFSLFAGGLLAAGVGVRGKSGILVRAGPGRSSGPLRQPSPMAYESSSRWR